MRIELEPDALVQSGKKLGSIGSQLGKLADALGEALGSGIASGMDPAGADFGIKYGHQAQDFAKGMADATDAHKAVGFMLEATGHNYENADAASTIGGSGPTGKMGGAPDKSAVADAMGINGAMVPPPAKWALIQTFLGPMWSWPSGNASLMRITGAQWRNFANGLTAFKDETSTAKGAVSQQHIPEAGKIGDALTDLAEGVDNMAQSATAMAKAIDDFARGVQDTQDAIRDLMDRISLDGLWDTVTGFLTGDGDDILREVADDVRQLLENFQSQVKGVVGLLGELTNLLGSAADSFQKWVRPILVEALGEDVGNTVADYVTWNTDVGVGVVTGLINTVSGVVSLADLDTWQGLADVAASVAEDPTKLPGVLENMGKQFVAWDKWSGDHPGRAAGEAAFNVGMLFVPGGALAKGGGVAKSLSYASRLFEEGRIPRLSDLPGLGGASHGLPGFEGVPGARAGIPEFNPGALPDSIVSPSTPGGIDAPTSPASVGGSGEPSRVPAGVGGESGGGGEPSGGGGAPPSSAAPSGPPSQSGPSAPSHAASPGDSTAPAQQHAPGSSSPATSNGAGPSMSEGGSPNGHGGGGSGVGDGASHEPGNSGTPRDDHTTGPESSSGHSEEPAHTPNGTTPGEHEPPAADHGSGTHDEPRDDARHYSLMDETSHETSFAPEQLGDNQRVAEALDRHGFSKDDFVDLINKPTDSLTPGERDLLNSVRDDLPAPDQDTVMQKVIPPGHFNDSGDLLPSRADDYIMGNNPRVAVDHVGGSVTVASDTSHLSTPEAIHDGLRLDYSETPFTPHDPGTHIIRFQAEPDSPGTYDVPRNSDMGGDGVYDNWDDPFTGNGFTKSGDDVIPEYMAKNVTMREGAEMWEVLDDGTQRLSAVLKSGEWIPQGN